MPKNTTQSIKIARNRLYLTFQVFGKKDVAGRELGASKRKKTSVQKEGGKEGKRQESEETIQEPKLHEEERKVFEIREEGVNGNEI